MPPEVQKIQPKAGVISDSLGKQTREQVTTKATERNKQKAVQEVVADLNRSMNLTNTKLTFSVDVASKQTIVKVLNSETQEVIRQIPSDEALKIAQHVRSLMGILYDASA